MAGRYYEDKKVFCYICRKTTLFTHRDLNNNIGVESHCGECLEVWFEWQNSAVEREMAKWIEYNSNEFSSSRFVKLRNVRL